MTRRPSSQDDARIARWLGYVIATTREQQDITSEELAALAGMSRPTLSMIENGYPHAKLSSIISIANELGMTLWHLMELTETLAESGRKPPPIRRPGAPPSGRSAGVKKGRGMGRRKSG